MSRTTQEFVRQLLQQLHTEINLYQQHQGTPEGEAHNNRARQIKAQLLHIQQQINRRRDPSQEAQGGTPGAPSAPNAVGGAQSSAQSSPAPANAQLNAQLGAQAGAGGLSEAQQQLQMQQLRLAAMQRQQQMQQLNRNSMNPGANNSGVGGAGLGGAGVGGAGIGGGAGVGGTGVGVGGAGGAGLPAGMSPAAAQQALGPQPNRTVNMNSANGYQQRIAQMEELRRHHVAVNTRIEQYEQLLRTRTNPSEITRLQQQLQLLRQRREGVRRRESMLMRELRQSLSQGQSGQGVGAAGASGASGSPTPGVAGTPGPATAKTPTPSSQTPGPQSVPPSVQQQQQQQQQRSGNAAQLQSQMLRGIPRNAQGQPIPANQINAARVAQMKALQQQMRMRQAQGAPGASQSPVPSAQGTPTPGAPGAPGAASTAIPGAGSPSGSTPGASQGDSSLYNPSVMVPPGDRPFKEPTPIPNQINVSPIQPVNVRPGRPTLTNGGGNDALAVNSPGLVRPPTVDATGDRLLSKRKLSDLVTSVVGDDNEPLIDGDVEELLLDLADEFVTSVTSFACKLARHRKSDILEAKDIHMHLERNWNMHIAGYSSDEVRSIRRFLPAQAYQQKLQSLLMAKSVQK